MNEGRIRNLVLMLADAACIAFCWTVAVLGYRVLGGNYQPEIYLRFWPVILAYLFLNALFRLYHGSAIYPSMPVSPVEEFRRMIGSAALVHVGVLTMLVLLHQTTAGYSRVVIVIAGILTAVFGQIARDGMRTVLTRSGLARIPVALVGSEAILRQIVSTLETGNYVGFVPIGYFSDRKCAIGNLRRLGGIRDAVAVCRRRNVKILIAGIDERILRCQLAEWTEWFTYIEYFPTAEVFPMFGSRTVSLGGIGGLEMVNQDRMRELRLEKWLLDKFLSLLAFALVSPFMLVIGLLVRLTSAGPAFYRHSRLGRHGQPIRIWKFRTMYRDADTRLEKLLSEDPAARREWHRQHKLKNDPRVTPFGRFLRKTSLDEIPQILNVLNGSMALVGPRPIVAEEVEKYGKAYGIFSSVKPGITGLWQISGRSDTDYEQRVSLDSYYVLNWSPWLDLWILRRTIGAVLFMRGAV